MTRIQFHPILSARENLSRRILPVFHPSLFKSLDGPFQWWFWSHVHLYISDHSECWIGFTPTTLALGAGLWWAEPCQTPPPARPQSRWSTGLLPEAQAEAGRRGRVRALERCCRTPHTPSRSVWGGAHHQQHTDPSESIQWNNALSTTSVRFLLHTRTLWNYFLNIQHNIRVTFFKWEHFIEFIYFKSLPSPNHVTN